MNKPSTDSTKRRILIADDNRDSADSLALLLGLHGNEVRTAYDGVETLDVASEFLPDVVLLDIGMPKLNGHEVAKRIREQPWGRSIALIAVTGWGQQEDRRRTSEVGFDHHLVKPIDPEALARMIAQLPARG